MQAVRAYIMNLIRWSTNLGIERPYTVLIYRLMIENHAGEGFIWMPYSVPEIMAIIPSSAHVHSNLWCISTHYKFSGSGVVSWRSSTLTVRLHTVYPDTASTIG
ncbi:hypothetical protein PVK06_024336 [Gossypium arboreum]|uniref:Serine/threonine-protein phosphatase 7 long form-like protein n=1 Tax=Gossypium arboreum TaxID=29729 RepID=A0ABR0PDQ2_GOSAR|nr:hypothetical protein PVK06_024336 [Gossypium arboreum]